jgi:hypothetical protein
VSAFEKRIGTALFGLLVRVEELKRENAALLRDKERLDWLATSSMWLDVPGTESFTPETLRAALDAARGEGGAT